MVIPRTIIHSLLISRESHLKRGRDNNARQIVAYLEAQGVIIDESDHLIEYSLPVENISGYINKRG